MPWTQILPSPTNIGPSNNSLTVFNGKLYCLFYGGQNAVQPNLWEWDGISSSWISVADTLSIGGHVLAGTCLAVFNGNLYAGSRCDDISNAHSGSLLEWDGISAWTIAADGLGGEYQIDSLCVFSGQLYGGTRQHGMLYQWNGVNAWTQVAGQLSGQWDIHSLLAFNNQLYGSTGAPAGPSGLLFQWNGTNSWVEVAAQYSGSVYQIFSFNNNLYGVTDSGYLLQWNGVNTWLPVTSSDGGSLYSAAVYNNLIFASGTDQNGALYQWDGISAWTIAAPGPGLGDSVIALAVFNGNLYGLAGVGGGILYQFTKDPPIVDTDPATNIGIYSAQLNGQVINDEGSVCVCGFQWGLTVAYGNTTATTTQITGDIFHQKISGLSSGATYHFRSFATNWVGTAYGNDLTFSTIVPISVKMAYPVKRRLT
jgi:hypothetical protein